MRASTAYWASAALRAAVTHRLFTHISNGANRLETLAEAAQTSLRGTRCLLDALTGAGMLTVEDLTYANTPETEKYLVEGRDEYAGGMVEFMTLAMPHLEGLADAVRTGEVILKIAGVGNHPLWPTLVEGISHVAVPVAEEAADYLDVANAGPIRMLDIAGGAGMYSAVFLSRNPEARAVQNDWPHVNQLAREYVAKRTDASRFETLDGDFHTMDYGEDQYDIVIFSQIAHGVGPEVAVEMFRRMRRTLKPGGTLVVSEYLVNEDGSGHPFALLFSTNLMVHSPDGAGWRMDEYERWLKEAGFVDLVRRETSMPATLIYAR